MIKDGRQTEHPDGLNGLYLVAYPSGRRTWAVRYRNAAGQQRKVILGSADHISLPDARRQALDMTASVSKGADPAAKAVASNAPLTVRQAAERFMAEHLKRKAGRALSARTVGERRRQFDAIILPAIGDRALIDLDGQMLRAVVKGCGGKIMPNRVHATLSKFMGWCADLDRGLIGENPYRNHKKPEGEQARKRVLSNRELAALWRASLSEGGHFGSILRLLILTGQRRSEVTGLRRVELDFAERQWIVPAERAKNGEAHQVPLSAPAMEEVRPSESLERDALLFTTTGRTAFAGHQKRKDAIDATLRFNEPWRLHDLRRTMATGLARLGVAQEVTEAVLNHRSGKVSGIAAVYNQHDYATEKRRALRLWGRQVQWIAAGLAEAQDGRRAAANDERASRIALAHRRALDGSDTAWTRYLDVCGRRWGERAAA